MSKVIMENIKITINPISISNNKLRYKSDKYTYDIILMKNYAYGHFEPIVILHNEYNYPQKFLSIREHRIPEIHCEILLELFGIFKDKIVLPLVLEHNIKYENKLIMKTN